SANARRRSRARRVRPRTSTSARRSGPMCFTPTRWSRITALAMSWATCSGCSTATSTASCAPICWDADERCATSVPAGMSAGALARRALAEDAGTGDVTTRATVDERSDGHALVTQKAPGVIFGLAVAEAVFAELDPGVQVERLVDEGAWREGGGVMSLRARAC